MAHPTSPRTAPSAPVGPAQYIVGDPGGGGARAAIVVPLGVNGQIGVVVDKARIVTGRGEPRVAADVPEQPISGAIKIPPRFGGGFLFYSEATLYRADTFEGELHPIVKVPDTVQDVSFATKFMLVRTVAGERWALSLPSGQRVAIDPLGVADIEALDDGRAIAFTDQSTVFTSTDGGTHWTDVTTLLRSSPQKVSRIDDDIWLLESSGAAQKLEADGHLSYFDHLPTEKPPEVRPRDPKWRGQESPLREAFRGGAAIDDGTALVVSDGDLVRIDIHTGEIISTVQGKLPPEARCEAVPTSNDVLFACVARNYQSGFAGGTAFVVSHTLSDEAPTVEQTFNGPSQFYGSDDGGLAYNGPCVGIGGGVARPGLVVPTPATPSASLHPVCVRQPGGSWSELDASGYVGDAGTSDLNVVRWVPRGDGRAVALVSDPTPGYYDPQSSTLVAVPPEARDVVLEGYSRYPRYGGKRGYYAYNGQEIVDWSWSFNGAGALRGWQRTGGIVEVGEDGKVKRSPYNFELVASGPYALGRSPKGRLFQSTDHGASWTEVAAPPSGAIGTELVSCSSAGCDLGGFYRVGWAARPPKETPEPTVAKIAPEVRRTRAVDLACRTTGAPSSKLLVRDDHSPDNLGLGVNRLPISNEAGDVVQLKVPMPRWMNNPIHPPMSGISGDMGDNPSLRAMFSGYQTQRDADVISVMGPNKSASQLHRSVTFVTGFDPAATVKKTSIAFSEIVTAGRNAGLSREEILQDDPTESGTMVLVTPHDPNAPSDLVFQNARGLVALIRSNERVRVGWRQTQGEGTLISGVATNADDMAFLETEATGVGHVYKMGASGISDLFDVFPTSTEGMFYPPNPDALAIGPKGDLGVLRMASGSDPASDLDPAVIIQQALPVQKLAPWSSLVLADDPSCLRDPGWRATLQVVTPWIRITTPDLRVEEAPMFARVKWNDKHVCLEGIEVKLPTLQIKVQTSGTDNNYASPTMVASWLVGRNGAFSRVSVSEGVEWRQALSCSISAPSP